MSEAVAAHSPRVRALYARRPRSPIVRGTVIALAVLVVYAWASGDVDVAQFLSSQRLDNARRFVTVELVPYPLRDTGATIADVAPWLRALLDGRGIPGASATLAIAVLAICLAGLIGGVLAPFAARTLARSDPFDGASKDRGRAADVGWRIVGSCARAALIFLRAIPEYVWAFLLLALLGASAWPAILALAIHNGGILGKLGAETIENLDRAPLRALATLGAGRRQVWLAGALPLSFARFLLYFLYRFETCVREATVLGMLGVVSLGYWIQDARTKQFYDEMVVLVALGGAIVLASDFTSALLRRFVRRAR